MFDLFDRDIKDPQMARKASRETGGLISKVDKEGDSTPVRCRVRADVSDVRTSSTPMTRNSLMNVVLECSMFRKLFSQGPRFLAPLRQSTHRCASNSSPISTSQGSTRTTRIRARLDRWIVRSPRLFKPTLITLRDAPTSYLISFAILHELTAIVPLASLTYAFHYYQWLPPYFAEGKWVTEGVEKFGRYFRKKGWMQDYDEVEVERETREGRALDVEGGGILGYWDRGDGMGRWLVEIATAYAVTKVLLPLRIALSVFWAPGFASWTLIPVTRALSKGLKR